MSKYLESKPLMLIAKWIKKLEVDEIALYSEKRSVKELKLPYKNIGAGRHRIVFDLGNGLVLKIAKVAKGIRCNKNEVELYFNGPSLLQKHLCKIIEYGHGWLIMKKIKKTVPQKKKYKKEVAQIYGTFFDSGIRISDLIDKKSGKFKKRNLGLNKHKEIVLIDYANIYKC